MSAVTLLYLVALLLAIVAAFPAARDYWLLNVAVVLLALGLFLGSGLVR